MASRKQPYAFLLLALSTLSFVTNSYATHCVGSSAISVYWGLRGDEKSEGTLKEACDTGHYNIVMLGILDVYDDGSTPKLDMSNHCDFSKSNPCSFLEPHIKHCQDLGIKVFLSIGLDQTNQTTDRDPISTSSSSSKDGDVTGDLAKYLFENFFSGKPDGPLGSVYLDGIDISDVPDNEHLHWDELVKLIKGFTTEREIYISVSILCGYEDYFLSPTKRTGLIDYVWVGFFFLNPTATCIYSSGSSENLLDSWEKWTSNVPNSSVFLGLAPNPKAYGYIPPDVLKSDILPKVKKASNYGGVMIWDRYYDRINDYTAQIKDSVPKSCGSVCDEPAPTSFNSLQSRSLLM